MRIPGSRRQAALLVPPDVDDLTAPAAEGAAESRNRDPILLLQRMERALVRAFLEAPGVLTDEELRRLRYVIGFARLTVFEPGTANGGERGRGDVDLTDELAPWREVVVRALTGPLRVETDPEQRQVLAREAYRGLEEEQDLRRKELVERHRGSFSATELDAEVGYKSLVLVLGGGGGAGFVYLGAVQQLLKAGKVPDYIIGSSIGAVLGSVLAREVPVPMDDYVEFAKSITYRALLGPEPARRRHGLVSVLSLRFDVFAAPMFERPDGLPMRMDDLAIPYDAVVAGVHQQLFSKLPARFRRQELATVRLRSLPHVPIGIGPAMASRLWQAASFIDSRIVKPLVIGGDEMTGQFNVADAASFSAAIPGVLHHETKDPRMVPLLDAWMAERKVAALVDGGAASNVPVELAWRRVQEGRIGTRNAMYLALDCFHPQWDPRHLWLTPITRAVQVQMVRNAPYADHLERMAPTLSPTNLAPAAAAFDLSVEWGNASMVPVMPFVEKMTEPIWWEGDAPVLADRPSLISRVSSAPSMKPIVEASRRSRAAMRDWRDRRFT
jgi:predicted acylesterase/phospholipase RssA